MIAAMRLSLALLVLLVVCVDPSRLDHFTASSYALFAFYVAYSTILYILVRCRSSLMPAAHRWSHWLDVGWYTWLSMFSNGTSGIFFFGPYFFVSAAAFQWGFMSGMRVALGSAVLFVFIVGVASLSSVADLDRLVLRSIARLVLGYIVAAWGGFQFSLRRQLELLKDITRLASPRFSSDRTIDSIMEHLRAFYGADACGLIRADQSIAGHHLLPDVPRSPKAAVYGEPMPTELARILGAMLPEQMAVYCGGRHVWRWWCPWASDHVYDVVKGERVTGPPDTNDVFATICGRRSLIVVPLGYQGEIGSWLYLSLKRRHAFSMPDADFLHQVVKHIEPILDNSRLVDRLAVNAADEERRRIARDLHDSVIQAHIGLQIGLDALRRKLIAGGTEVVKDINHLIEMIDAGVVDLRCYVRGLKDGGEPVGELLPAVQRFARRFAEVTGIAIHVKAETDICINGRLAAEAFQAVAEGLSNVRRHTNALQATVSLACSEGHLILRIENEGMDGWVPFTPRSITERAEALGGQAQVERREDNGTTVLVTIPL